MLNVDVCLSPGLIGDYGVKNKVVVVVDILRATSCMVTALSNGAFKIVPVESVDECWELKEKGYLAAAERDGKIVAGFEIGNSPYSYLTKEINGSNIAITTTNGTKAIKLSKDADQILIGAFLNLSSLARYILLCGKDVLIVCAGWKNKMNLEDTIFAGALLDKLKEKYISSNDSAIAASLLYNMAKKDLFGFITQHSSHYKRLKNLNLDKDIAYCLQIDAYDTIPVMNNDQMVVLNQSATVKVTR
jgi:2-phosphosulfolactate phosphatase